MEGDAASGKAFSTWLVPFEGKYVIKGNVLTMTVSKWPRLVGVKGTKREIRNWLKNSDTPLD
jgi:hypothetical protein